MLSRKLICVCSNIFEIVEEEKADDDDDSLFSTMI